jgi:hypothetical protein
MNEIPGRPKAFRAEAKSRREDKANRAAIYFEPLHLCASARVQLFFHTFCGRGVPPVRGHGQHGHGTSPDGAGVPAVIDFLRAMYAPRGSTRNREEETTKTPIRRVGSIKAGHADFHPTRCSVLADFQWSSSILASGSPRVRFLNVQSQNPKPSIIWGK